MNTITNLILDQGRTYRQSELFVHCDGRIKHALHHSRDRHFQLLPEWRNNCNDDRASESVIGPKACLTTQIVALTGQFSFMWLRPLSTPMTGPTGRQRSGLAMRQRRRQGKTSFAFFQAIEGSVRAILRRRSS